MSGVTRRNAGHKQQKVCSTKVAEPHQLLSKLNLGSRETGCRGFVGGYIRRVTPVPIPNTVVKPAEPMILPQRESRSLPAFTYGTPVRKHRGSFLRRARDFSVAALSCAQADMNVRTFGRH
jgi:hypothetical protein